MEQLRRNLEESTAQWKKVEEPNVLQNQKSCLEGILEDMERNLSSQKELTEKKRGTLEDKNELLGKVDAEFSYLKGKINEISRFSSWQTVALSSVQEEMNEQRWRLETESDLLSTYWHSLSNLMQAEIASSCRGVSDTKQVHKETNTQVEAGGVTSLVKVKTSRTLHAINSQPELWKMAIWESAEQAESEEYLAQIVDLGKRLRNVTADLEGRLDIKEAEVLCLVESLEESRWKNDVEIMLILCITESLNRQATQELHSSRQEMGLKDGDFFCLALEANHLKQVLEDMENDFSASKSVYTMPVADNSSLGDETESGFLQNCFHLMLQNNSDLEQAQEGEVSTSSEVGELPKSRKMILEEPERKKILQIMEKFPGKKLQHELEIYITARILEQKYQEAAEGLISKFTIDAINSEVATQRRAASVLDRAMHFKNIESDRLEE